MAAGQDGKIRMDEMKREGFFFAISLFNIQNMRRLHAKSFHFGTRQFQGTLNFRILIRFGLELRYKRD